MGDLRADYGFPPIQSGSKPTINEYLRENFCDGILAGKYLNQDFGAMDNSWSLSYQAYLDMVNTARTIRTAT